MTGRLELGRVVGVFGVRGWIKIRSITEPPEQILEYRSWWLGEARYEVEEGRLHGELVAVKLAGTEEREAGLALRGLAVEVERREFPRLRRGEFYWADLLGGEVESEAGVSLGKLASVTNNGAQDVMVVRGERERLIPYVRGVIVKSVDSVAKRIVVDWDPEY